MGDDQLRDRDGGLYKQGADRQYRPDMGVLGQKSSRGLLGADVGPASRGPSGSQRHGVNGAPLFEAPRGGSGLTDLAASGLVGLTLVGIIIVLLGVPILLFVVIRAVWRFARHSPRAFIVISALAVVALGALGFIQVTQRQASDRLVYRMSISIAPPGVPGPTEADIAALHTWPGETVIEYQIKTGIATGMPIACVHYTYNGKDEVTGTVLAWTPGGWVPTSGSGDWSTMSECMAYDPAIRESP